MNIAFLSPNQSSYSETFIKVQKEGLNGHVLYYYGGFVPTKLEGQGSISIKFGHIRKRLGLLYKDVSNHSLKQSFLKEKIDVVLAQYGPTGEAVAAICETLNLPLVVHFHGYDASIKTVIARNNRYENAFRVAQYVVAVSQEMIVDLIALGCPKEKIVYNPCAPQDIFYSVNPTFSVSQFLSVGRFTDKKGPTYTIKAFKQVVAKHPKARLFMAGTGELLESCKILVNDLGLQNHIVFLGSIMQQQLLDIMENSLAFVQHSITASNGDKEGTPVAIMEASAAGLPIIATRHAGIPDVVKHGETGFLVDERDVNTMGDYMLSLIKNKNLAINLGTCGKANIQNHFSMPKHLSILQDVLNKSTEVNKNKEP
ncbi:glycosyltransferase [Aestuariivivens marinum]|uniref:glycosyltransferase n=1 Tax=Aestuariivivens marinum TaxID=2913555 RepID=UPI001F5A7FEF|nr:glycosyltransferase [Aestuariivivens marinum]